MLFLFIFAIINLNQGGILMQRYFAKNKIDNELVLYESDIHHIKNVMRSKENDKIEVVYDETVYICNINSINPLTLSIIDTNSKSTDMNVELVVAISLVQEQKFDLIIQKLTELGVSRIIPIKTERSIVKLDTKKEDKKITRWQTICKEASEQSKRTSIPKIEPIKNIKDIINEKADIHLVCSLNENTRFIDTYLTDDIKRILFVIGPEGGFTKKEEEYLLESNFKPVSLGKRVLRVETAAIYVTSIINYRYKG